MSELKITADETDVIRALDNIEKKFAETGKKAEDAIADAFDFSEAKEGVSILNSIQKEFDEIRKAADILKNAMKGATDPAVIKLYAENIGKLEKGMKDLGVAGKAVGLNLEKANKEAGTGRQVFEGFFGAFTKATIIIAAVQAVVQFTKYAVGLSQEISRSARAFEAFTGSAEEAQKIVASLQSTANKNFLPLDETLQAGKALLAFGESASDLPDVLTRIANVSAATGKNFGELTTIYGKARAAGVLYAEDINQLVDAGIPIIQEFAKQMNVSNADVKKLASEGKISFEELQLAMFNLTAEGGKFAGQAQIQAESIGGAWTKLVSVVQPAIKAVGDVVSEFIIGAIGGMEIVATSIKNLFSDTPPVKIEVDYTGRDAYEKAKDDLYEKNRLEEEAEKARKSRNAKSSSDAVKFEKERSKLRIDALRDGEEKEIAIENLRFNELVKQLKRYHIDTSQAEEQHQKNLVGIAVKFGAERMDAANELLEIRRAQGKFEAEQAKNEFDRRTKEIETERALSEILIDTTEAEFNNLVSAMKAGGAKEEDIKTAQLEFDKQISAARIKVKIDTLEALLAIEGNGKEAEIIKANIQNLKVLLEGLDIPEPKSKDGKPKSIYDILGIKFDDPETQQAFEEAVSIIQDSLNQLTEARVREAEATSKAAQEKVDAAQEALDKEKEIAEQGLANFVDIRQKDLDAAKQQRDNALKEEAKAKKAQIALDSIGQVSGLITSSVNIFKSLSGAGPIGIAIAVATIALMFGAFAKVKADALKAASAPKLRLGKRFDGPTHEQGNEDIVHDGKRAYKVENGEWLIGTAHSKEHNGFLANLNGGKYRGYDLAAMAERRSDTAQLMGASSSRTEALRTRREKVGEQQHLNALAGIYEVVGDRIVRAIEEKPESYPWKDGYVKVERKGGNVTRRTVTPSE